MQTTLIVYWIALVPISNHWAFTFQTQNNKFVLSMEAKKVSQVGYQPICSWINYSINMILKIPTVYQIWEVCVIHTCIVRIVSAVITGASTQLSFTSTNAEIDRFTMNLFNADYDVYSHSYLCYGTEQFRWVYLANLINQANGSTVTNDPCLQEGFVDDVSYDEIFGTPCVRDRYAPLPSLDTSLNYSFV